MSARDVVDLYPRPRGGPGKPSIERHGETMPPEKPIEPVLPWPTAEVRPNRATRRRLASRAAKEVRRRKRVATAKLNELKARAEKSGVSVQQFVKERFT
jgi:hypothetical protein